MLSNPVRLPVWGVVCLTAALALHPHPAKATTPALTCNRTLTADVVALDQAFSWNRLGALQPQGMMFALRRDVVPISGTSLTPGNVKLRSGKRPRPMVLRMNAGDCLQISFQNLLSPTTRDEEQPSTRYASLHAVGMNLVGSDLDDGSYVGQNANGLLNVGQSAVYTLSADREGEHVLYSMGTTTGGEGDGGQINAGLFGAILVEPSGSKWYRSQVTRAELLAASNGTSSSGHPIVNYNALKILSGTEIIYSDLTAIIDPTEPQPEVAVYPHRGQPFREFTIIYHDETGAVQAFPEFEDPVLSHTLHSVRDNFAINYGSAGAGAEILANRFGVGPMRNCVDCNYEEFFLSSWAVGDPAMVVDVPANDHWPSTGTNGVKATKALYPDDPSNVYHSYLRDHTKFRVLHAGSKEHHVHHLHAHQWLSSPDVDTSSYLDSQALGPGASFTAEIAHEGGGNLNLTPGDSIFHCHFYPHFAQGMWALWRVHDVFEDGTLLDGTGKPAAGSRALPDGEIAAGTPIPALVPLPGLPMAPLPGATVKIVAGQPVINGTGNPGYPFFVPATAGHRPPAPPMDFVSSAYNGGLPRHTIVGGTVDEKHTRLDFHKHLVTAVAQSLPANGTNVEQNAMAYHATRLHPTCRPDGTCGVSFETNGLPAVAGAPFADPCITAGGAATGSPRVYKAADIQTDVTFNKAGWHFPQQRFISLWEDVNAYLGLGGNTRKAPEPLFFRANTGDCIEYQLTNLVPNEFKQDDFQVRTPTDILGQHIHLVKFDVLASDGGANGFNYEDGSFSPGEVRLRIAAIRAQNNCVTGDSRDNTFTCPLAKTHPFFGAGPDDDGDGVGDWIGAQTTIQRWYADPVKDNAGNDRTLRTVFTHDHFGPSTHQQTGLYAGLVVEPENSTWKHNETGEPFYTRADGGPTSWQAIIEAPSKPRQKLAPSQSSYREFLLEFSDYQLAYTQEATTYPNTLGAINPPAKAGVPLTSTDSVLLRKTNLCPGNKPAPCPEAISAADVGTMVVNYRNEPVALRVRNPATNFQATGKPGDLSFAFSSNITRADTRLNTQPLYYPALTAGVRPQDPYTPLLRAYANDSVQIRVLVGGHEEGHNFSINGVKWLQEPSNPDSGWRASQMMGISEHFEMIVPQLIGVAPSGKYVDRLWQAGSAADDVWNGTWGLLRAYHGFRADLQTLSDNPVAGAQPTREPGDSFSCPPGVPKRNFSVTAIRAKESLPTKRLSYNSRTDGSQLPLFDPQGTLFVRTDDLDTTVTPPVLKPGVPIEPLVLRARAGECVKVTLINAIQGSPLLAGNSSLPMIVDGYNANSVDDSDAFGLHPQMLYYDISRYDGANIGTNAEQTTEFNGGNATYEWYAGDVTVDDAGTITATPIEFGATNLISSDPIKHPGRGAFGALIIEPVDATWSANARSEATITSPSSPGGSFREVVLQLQTDVNMYNSGTVAVENLAGEDDPEDSGQVAVNYRAEPLWKRMQHAPDTPLEITRTYTDWWDVLSNTKVGGDPQTPVYSVKAGTPVRIRLLQAGGHSRNGVFMLHGHEWDRQPYLDGSTRIGPNAFSLWEGARMGVGPTSHFDLVLRNGAGGKSGITGDYLFHDASSGHFDNGLWGILRVVP